MPKTKPIHADKLEAIMDRVSATTAKECFHCKQPIAALAPYYHVQQAVKPPKVSHRWKTIGYCCTVCESKGAALTIEYQQQLTEPKELCLSCGANKMYEGCFCEEKWPTTTSDSQPNTNT